MYILRLNTYPLPSGKARAWILKIQANLPNIIIVTRYGEPGTPRISCTWCDSVSQWREQHNYTKLEKIVVYVVYIQCINVYMYICIYMSIPWNIILYHAIPGNLTKICFFFIFSILYCVSDLWMFAQASAITMERVRCRSKTTMGCGGCCDNQMERKLCQESALR